MELSRRDVLAALAATGAVAAGSAALDESGVLDVLSEDDPLDEHDIRTLVAVAEVVYPSAVTGVEAFVTQYVVGRVQDREEYAGGMHEAVATLDDYARDWHDAEFAAIDATARDELLRQMGVPAASPAPDGLDADRVRYYVVNDLLYALYTTPTGGELAGIENPQGFPGGTTSYQRGPDHG
ncbi:gluconate 2-dehydrogenase subunit 3 family protein [Halobacteriaceae archaeon GCM10025711]